MHITTPPNVKLQVPTSALLASAARQLAERTSLVVQSVEQGGFDRARIDTCPFRERFTCWVRAVQRKENQPRFLLVVAVLPAPCGKGEQCASFQLYPILVDTERSLEIIDASRRSRASREDTEARVFEASARTRPTPIESLSALDSYFANVFDQQFRGRFEQSGHWRPYGAVEIDSPVSGLSIDLDGRTIGATREGTIRLENVLPGDRQLILRGPRGHVQQEIATGATGQVAKVVALPPPEGTSIARTATLWTGVTVAVAGAALTTFALVQAGDDIQNRCLVRPGNDPNDCAQLGTLTLGYSPDSAPSTDPSAVNPSGVLVGPLGASLLVTGGAWAAGAALLGDEDDAPWWSIGIGIAAGALTYGLGAALDPR